MISWGWRLLGIAGILQVLLLSLTGEAWAERRVALVIGNSAYEHVPQLAIPRNDATDIAKSLERLGFSVRKESELDHDSMRRALREFSHEASGADIAAIFFAGHGLEVDSHNYLIPVDARLGTDKDVPFEAISLDYLLRSVEGARGLGLVLLDACRNNPFLASMKMASTSRSVNRGLARVDPTGGVLVGYAAKEGTTAADGDAHNSPYTSALLEHLETPGLEIRLLFGKVRDAVLARTNDAQEPFVYGSLGGEPIYLVPPGSLGDYVAAARIGTPEAWEAFNAERDDRLAGTPPKKQDSLPPKRKLIYDRIIGEETLEE